MVDNARRVLFLGVSAVGHGGIQRFNRRVVEALSAAPVDARSAMLDNGRWRLIRLLIKEGRRAEVLLLGHVNLLPLAVVYRLLRPRGRVILFAHGIEVWGDPAFRRPRWFEPAIIRRLVDRVAIVSRYSQARMAAVFGLEEQRFTLFPNAVELVSNEQIVRREQLVLAVARLGAGEREKNVDALVRAAAVVPGMRLTVIGDGPLRSELRALAQALGVHDRVTLPGAVSDEALDRAYAEGRFTGNANEAVADESEAGASYYLSATLQSGTLTYRVAQ